MFDILSKAVVNDLLSSWLPLSCVGRLDSAFCVHDRRSLLITYLQASSFGNKLRICQYYGSSAFFSWILTRKVKLQVTKLTLQKALIQSGKLRCDVLALVGRGLNEMTIQNSTLTNEVAERTIMDVALYCTNLKACDIGRYTDTTINSLLARNPDLERLRLHECASPKESELLHTISILCPRIVAIDLRVTLAKHSFQTFLSALPSSLQSLCLRRCDTFTWPIVLDILRHCTLLNELRIGFIKDQFLNEQPLEEFVHLRTFRAEIYHLYSVNLAGLSKMMPCLTTAILISRVNDDAYPQGAKTMIDHFPYLRQLVTIARFEDKLRNLQAPTLYDDFTSYKPAAGSRLEELFAYSSAAIVKNMSVPMLAVFGCYYPSFPPVLPTQVKSFVLVGDTRAGEDKVLRQLHGLEEIDITFNGDLPSDVIHRIALQNPNLKVLSVKQSLSGSNDFPVLTADGLWIFVANCPQLHSVIYSATHLSKTEDSTEHVSALLKKSLCKLFPNLKNLTYSLVV